jgi:LPS export ABC transporter protein LptC
MRHFGDNDVSEYDKVTLSSFEPKKPNLVVTADHAERLKNNETIFLSGHVGVTQESSARDLEPWIMSTERLEIYPNIKQGQSKEPVTVTHGKDRLEAVTMRFDYNLSTVKFERAHTLYAPHHR